jgi:hypothetical protein
VPLTVMLCLPCSKRLRALPELEREMELSNRGERQEKESFRKMLAAQSVQPKESKQLSGRSARSARQAKQPVVESLSEEESEDNAQEGHEDGKVCLSCSFMALANALPVTCILQAR